jgi:lipoteichoic acid synthase
LKISVIFYIQYAVLKNLRFLLFFFIVFILNVLSVCLLESFAGTRWIFWAFLWSLVLASIFNVFTNRWWVFCCLALILTILIYSNILYFRSFNSLIPYTSFTYLNNLKGLSGSIYALMRLEDLLILIPFFLLLFFFIRIKQFIISFKYRIVQSLCTILIAVSLLISDLSYFYGLKNSWSFLRQYYYYDTSQTLKPFGVIGYWVWDISQSFFNEFENNNINANTVNAFLLKKKKENSFNIEKKISKNIILIIVESLESWTIDEKIENKEITPNISKLLKSKESFYCPNIFPQTKGGRSSDCQFMLNTGLMPLSNEAVFFKYPFNTYHTLIESVKGNYNYQSFYNFIGNKETFWNQNAINSALGFTKLYSEKDLNNTDKFGMGISDSSLFQQICSVINQEKQPFYFQIITLSSHTPFIIPKEKTKIKLSDTIEVETKKYLTAINYTDYSIGILIDNLKSFGIFDKTILIITGDHEIPYFERTSILKVSYMKKLVPPKGFVPLIVVNGLKSGKCNETMGQIDIFPSLLNILGIQTDWHGVGNNIFNTVNEYYTDSRNESFYRFENMTQMEISSYIIRNDFFKK